jgi:hypothetical protein
MAREVLSSVLIENVLVDGRPVLRAPGPVVHIPAYRHPVGF